MVRFSENRGAYRHVWLWDEANGKLTYTQIRRGKHIVRARHWASKLMCHSPIDAIASLRPFGDVQWYGKDAINELRQAFTA